MTHIASRLHQNKVCVRVCARPGLMLGLQEMETDIEMDKKFLQILGFCEAETGVKNGKNI